jgi:hypothetical protein
MMVMLEKIKQRFASLSMKKGYITEDHVIEALKIQVNENIEKSTHRPIGQILLELGYMNKQQLNDVMDMFVEPRFGDVAITKKFISANQLIQALSVQVREESKNGKHRLIGEILLDHGYMSPFQIRETLDAMQHAN